MSPVSPPQLPPEPVVPSSARRYALAAVASLLTAVLTLPLLRWLDLTNIAMLFLLTVVLVSMRYGRRASMVATLVGVSALALTRKLFALGDLQYVVTLLVMLAVGLITGKLTANLRYQLAQASQREARSRALYEFARALSGVLQMEQVFDSTRTFVQATFYANVTLLLPDDAGLLQYPVSQIDAAFQVTRLQGLDLACAQWAYDHAQPAGAGSDTAADSTMFYLPLVAPMRTRGILVIEPLRRMAGGAPCRNCASSLRPLPRWPRLRLNACITSRWRRTRWCAWSPSACAIRCWPRSRTTCARR